MISAKLHVQNTAALLLMVRTADNYVYYARVIVIVFTILDGRKNELSRKNWRKNSLLYNTLIIKLTKKEKLLLPATKSEDIIGVVGYRPI